MKKVLSALFCVLAFSLFFTQFVQAADWTFMVYLDGDNNLEGAGINDFMEMASVGSDSTINIVVQFDRIPGEDNSYGDWTTTHRFLITPGMTPTEANAISDWGDGSGGREVNMADPQTLIDFVEWAMDNYPATNYAVILWNHGGGWRETEAAELRKPRYKAVCWDDTSGDDTLYMSEVKDALSSIEASIGRNINLLGFDACLMGMVEVAYQIRDHADIMVGSEEVEPGDGWPYDTLLADLKASPTMTATDLGTIIVNRYGESYGVNSDTTQSAINLSMMNSLATTISDFAIAMDSNKSEITTARSASQEYDYPEHIDLYHFAELVSTGVSDPDIQNAALNVMTAIENAVFAEFHGTQLPNSHGLAIYFPKTETAFDPDYNATVIDFPADTQWDEFLQWFYGGPPSCPSLYFWDGSDYKRRGFIFPGAMPREKEYRDHIPLKLVPKDGQYYLQIRETEPENSFIDMAKLIIVDHSSNTGSSAISISREPIPTSHTHTSEILYKNKSYVASGSNVKVLSPTSATHSVIGNVLPLLRFSDDRYVKTYPGDIITLTFPNLPLQAGKIRDFIFVGEGFYVPLNRP